MKSKITSVRDNRILSYFLPIILLLGLVVLFAAMTGGRFIKAKNLELIVNQAMIVGTVATGGVLIFASGNMNVAMGGSTAIACIIGGYVYLQTGSPVVMILSCIVGGLVIMALCCLLSEVFRINIVVITLILMSMLSSLQDWLVGSNVLKIDSSAMKALSGVPLIIFVVYFIVCLVIFDCTKLGRTLKFIGENSTCARQTGINEKKVVVIAFLLSGVAIGLGAFSTLVRTSSVSSGTCGALNMDIILAIVLAGTPMTGGNKSKIFSGIVGALMVTVLNSGLLMVGVNSIFIQAVRGVFFIVMVMLSEKREDVLPVRDMV